MLLSSFILALVCAFFGVLPLALRFRSPGGMIGSAVMFVLAGVAGWILIYQDCPSTVYPLLGGIGLWVLALWSIVALTDLFSIPFTIDRGDDPVFPWTVLPPVLFGCALLLVSIGNSAMLNSKEYASMAGVSEERVWTNDIQPKDPKHMLMGSRENAFVFANKAITQGKAGSIGSQFHISPHITLQKVNGEFWYVAPLDFNNFSVWKSSDGVPAYIKVSAEDPNRQPIKVELKDKMLFTPEAWFDGCLLRHLRNSYLNRDFYEFRFEIDEEGNPWWIVPAFVPQCGWWAEKITDLLVVNPVSGEIKRYDPQAQPGSPEAVPDWVDRVYPGELIEDYLAWRGMYHLGWINTMGGFPFFGAQKDLTEPQEPILIYSSEGKADWVSGITSTNNADDAIIGLVYTDSRTGKSVSYKVQGGATEEAVVRAVNANEGVQFRQLFGVNPQIYNCEGVMASIVPLLNKEYIFQAVAIVDIMNLKFIAVGSDQYQALRQFQKLMGSSGQQVALSNNFELKELTAPVARIGFDHVAAAYFLYFAGTPHLFSLDSTVRPTLPLTQVGDMVKIKYENSGQRILPVLEFENTLLPLEGTADETAVTNKAAEHQQEEQQRSALPTAQEHVKDKIKNMSTKELQALEKQLSK